MKRNISKIMILMMVMLIPTGMFSQIVIKVKPAKPKVIVNKPPKPHDSHVWIDGHWQWDKKKKDYVWVKGHWKKPKKGRAWVPGHWEQVPGGHKWVPGHWKKHKPQPKKPKKAPKHRKKPPPRRR